jgi:hypothetical protein
VVREWSNAQLEQLISLTVLASDNELAIGREALLLE